MFSPAYGVVEDAATGSAAGPLAIHLARHNIISFNKTITITQGVEMGRPSHMHATATGTKNNIQNVTVKGNAKIVIKGKMFV
jgi:trans-2,3-dihydro-3-hydroxyanthranilate isomerase